MCLQTDTLNGSIQFTYFPKLRDLINRYEIGLTFDRKAFSNSFAQKALKLFISLDFLESVREINNYYLEIY